MTAEEKNTLARFLDCTADYLKDGYLRSREAYAFSDDAPPNAVPLETSLPATSLPLAYQIDEFDENDESGEDDDTLDAALPTAAPLAATLPATSLPDLAALVGECRACALAATRKHAVPGEGIERPLVLVIGEGPGADEDATGRPFVGKAGQLLDKMLASIGLSRTENCYIANIVKCRPPGNRDPQPAEVAACIPFLHRQIQLLRPRAILCAGRVAAQTLLNTSRGITALRGEFTVYNGGGSGAEGEKAIPVLCTYHPSALLRDESYKRPAWEDLKLLKSHLDEGSAE